jgi:glutathione S-transferase
MALTLLIGNKNYSSWSLRPWIAMKVAGIPFEEIVVSLDAADFKARALEIADTGKVPALKDGATKVWESLAILEYLAEKYPSLWPADAGARAHARAVSSEMHAGFAALRRECPMNFCRATKVRELTPEAIADVTRINALWTDCRSRFGNGGPFLFGPFTAADAMYAPIVSRFQTYAVDVNGAARDYMRAVTALPAWAEWGAAARQETWVLPRNEVDWPTVLRA